MSKQSLMIHIHLSQLEVQTYLKDLQFEVNTVGENSSLFLQGMSKLFHCMILIMSK